jgi:Uma2 family endonuclease
MTLNLAEPQLHLLTRSEYRELFEAGYFEGKRVELVGGRIYEMPPMKASHATSLTLVSETLRQTLAAGLFLRVQMPLGVTETSEPEPDIAIVAGTPLEYSIQHPITAIMVVEVADASLRHDRAKASLYAQAGIPDYWIVNLIDRVLEVHRDPVSEPASQAEFRYTMQQTYSEQDSIAPLFSPNTSISVRSLLPLPSRA